jgi:flagellar protein FlbD
MIELHRLDDTKLLINTDLIESIQEVPDTIITLSNGNRYIMKENLKEVLRKIVDFKFGSIIRAGNVSSRNKVGA